MTITRRDFARRSAFTGASVALVGSVGALATAPGALAADDSAEADGGAGDEAGKGGHGPGYGPLVPDPEGILALPAGFSYRIITHSGVTRLESGEYTPSNHDGTAAFEGPRGTTLLVNNHELKGARSKWKHPVPLAEGLVYDPAASGGCTVVEVHRCGEVARGSPWTELVGVLGGGSASRGPPPTARAAAPAGAPG